MKEHSTEVCLPSPQLLCEYIMQQRGTDRGEGRRLLFDADIEGQDIDGTPYSMRLIQQRSFGAGALYTLRAQPDFSSHQSVYRYDTAENAATQQVGSGSITIPPEALVPLLQSALR